jgi:5-amino-6-(5-phosphoribosylamino)uracil reductase
MVASADGRATLTGRTAPMSGAADRELFHHLRAAADGILVGAGTVRTERYGRVTKTDALRALREEAGLNPDGVAVIVSGSLGLPPDLPLFQEPAAKVIVITASEGEIEGVPADIDYVRTGGDPRLGPALGELRTRHGIRSLLCEGGPTLNGSLFAEGLVDELFVTIANMIAGTGEDLTIVDGEPLPEAVALELLSVHESEGHLFLRYAANLAGREA